MFRKLYIIHRITLWCFSTTVYVSTGPLRELKMLFFDWFRKKFLKYENLIGIRMRMKMRLGMGMINTWSARGRRLNTLWGRLRTFCAGLRSSHHLGPFLQWKRWICFHSPYVPFISLSLTSVFLLCPFLSLLAAFQILPTFTDRDLPWPPWLVS